MVCPLVLSTFTKILESWFCACSFQVLNILRKKSTAASMALTGGLLGTLVLAEADQPVRWILAQSV